MARVMSTDDMCNMVIECSNQACGQKVQLQRGRMREPGKSEGHRAVPGRYHFPNEKQDQEAYEEKSRNRAVEF